MAVKKGCCSLEEARKLAYETDQETKQIKDANLTTEEYIDKTTEQALIDLKCKFIKQYLKESL
jgi:hypothetical protein